MSDTEVQDLLNKSPLEVTLYDLLRAQKDEILRTLHCVKIGQIVSFDGDKKTAQVQILFKRVRPDSTISSYPLLFDCPVFTPQGGGAALLLPIQPGDQCIVLFSDRNIDNWFQSGIEAVPFDSRVHNLSDGIAIVGLNSLSSDLINYSPAKASLNYLGASVELQGGLITLKNNVNSLGPLLTGLITVIEGLLVQDGSSMLPLTAASIAALEAYKLQIEALLY